MIFRLDGVEQKIWSDTSSTRQNPTLESGVWGTQGGETRRESAHDYLDRGVDGEVLRRSLLDLLGMTAAASRKFGA